MQLAERHSIAQRIVSRLSEVSPEFALTAFGPIVRSRIEAALSAIDAVAIEASMPLLVAELLPGVDLIVVRDFTKPAPRASAETPSLDSIWDRETVGGDWIDALTDLVTGALASRGVNAAGAYHHMSPDGMHYFVFDSAFRSVALQQLGIESGDVLAVSPESVEVAQ